MSDTVERALGSARHVITGGTGVRLLSRTSGYTAADRPVADRAGDDDGDVVCASGPLGGIEAALVVVERLHGPEVAGAVARRIEYAPASASSAPPSPHPEEATPCPTS